jgi:hypothetical protein
MRLPPFRLFLTLLCLWSLACGEAPAPGNQPPVLTGPAAQTAEVYSGAPVALTLEATDPDGDSLTYAWGQAPPSPAGAFNDASSATPTWTAPQVTVDTSFQVGVTVSDGKNGSVHRSVTVRVHPPLPTNRSPTVAASITGPSTLLAGDTGTFSLTASDPDGDPLSWSWSQSAPATQGTFVGATTLSSAQWFSPELSTQTSFTLSVTVTDGQSPGVTRAVTVPVTVPHYTDVQQTWEAVPCTSCHGSSGGVNLRTGVSYGNLVNINASACGLKRVVPGDPNNSAIVLKMEGNACGIRMPSNDQAYFDDNPGMVVRVRSWILAGAANN